MKERHKAGAKLNAIETLNSLSIHIGQDFRTLSRDQVDNLLAEANRVRYQKPARANGSRARYFHDLLQRQAQYRG